MGRVRVLAVAATAALLVALSATPADAHTVSYGKAKRAAQNRADRFAGQRVEVNSLLRINRHRYFVQARWERVDPDGCRGCDFDPITFEPRDSPTTVYCSAAMTVRFKSRRSRQLLTRITDSACF